MIKIARVTAAHKKDLPAVNGLLRQLSQSARRLDMKVYRRLLANKNFLLIGARDGGRLVGMGLLVLMEIPAAFRARMEDVVVDEAYRGRGIGTAISRMIVAAARKKGAASVDFTSRPDRVKANRLYEHLGFEKRDTNVYRLKLRK